MFRVALRRTRTIVRRELRHQEACGMTTKLLGRFSPHSSADSGEHESHFVVCQHAKKYHVITNLQVTLGPKGRNVVLERAYGAPEIVNDGVTIARDIEVADHQENVGVKLVQEVAQKSDNR